MEKLELKHIAPYLPYGVEAIHDYSDRTMRGIISRIEINKRDNDSIWYDISLKNKKITRDISLESIKPLLRPLSDLYKEIDGEIPADILFPKEYYSLIDFYEEHNRENQIQSFIKDGLNWCETYSFWEYLLSKHFDVFSLIDKGLAINLNSITHE